MPQHVDYLMAFFGLFFMIVSGFATHIGPGLSARARSDPAMKQPIPKHLRYMGVVVGGLTFLEGIFHFMG